MGDGTNQYSDGTSSEIYISAASVNKETGTDSKSSRVMILFNTVNIFNQKMGRFAFINYLVFP